MQRSEKAKWHMRKRGTVSLERVPGKRNNKTKVNTLNRYSIAQGNKETVKKCIITVLGRGNRSKYKQRKQETVKRKEKTQGRKAESKKKGQENK